MAQLCQPRLVLRASLMHVVFCAQHHAPDSKQHSTAREVSLGGKGQLLQEEKAHPTKRAAVQHLAEGVIHCCLFIDAQ